MDFGHREETHETKRSADGNERMRSRGVKFLAAALSVVVVGALAVPLARAQSGWTGFGYTNAYGRGSVGSVWVDVESVTKKDPSAIRFRVEGTPNRPTRVQWDISCWNGSTWYNGPEFSSSTFTVSPPFTKDVNSRVPGGVSSWDYCELDVSAYRFDGGRLNVRLEAQY